MPESDIDTNLPERTRLDTRRPIPIEAIIDYHFKGLSTAKIAKLFDCSARNIQVRLKRAMGDIKRLKTHIKYRPEVYAYHEMKELDAITPAKRKKSKALENAIAAEKFHRMGRLERGESTANVAYADMVKMEKEKRVELARLEKEMGEATVERGVRLLPMGGE